MFTQPRSHFTCRYAVLDDALRALAAGQGADSVSCLAAGVHVYPDFHGNRSPLADPGMTAAVCGLTLDDSLAGEAVRYLATVSASPPSCSVCGEVWWG